MSVSIDLKVNNVSVAKHLRQCEDIPIVFRNRDWTPVFAGFSFDLGRKVPNPPVKNQLVLASVEGDNHYLGFLERFNFNEDRRVYECEVTNYLMKLEKYRVNWSTLHSYLNNTANFTGAKTFTVDTVNNEIDCVGHGLSNGYVIQVRSSGTLPTPLAANTYYWVRSLTADSFKIFSILADYQANTNQVDFTDSGTGTHTFALADWNKYQGALEQFGAENVNSAASLKWITEKMFEIAGMALDTSLVDDIILHRFTISAVEYDWHWDEIYLDENMLFCLNQNVAINPLETDTGTDYIDNQITFLEFIQDLFGKLGFAIKFIGDGTTKTYLLIPQKRDVDGVIQPDDEDVFAVSDYHKISYLEDTIIDDGGGWSHSRSFHTNRSYYAEMTPQDIEEYTGKIRTNAGRTSINWWNNLRFYLRDFTASNYSSNYLISPGTYGYEFYNIPYYSAIINQTNSLLNQSHEEIECRADYLNGPESSYEIFCDPVEDATIYHFFLEKKSEEAYHLVDEMDYLSPDVTEWKIGESATPSFSILLPNDGSEYAAGIVAEADGGNYSSMDVQTLNVEDLAVRLLTIKELSLDVKMKRIKIIQEQNLLASG